MPALATGFVEKQPGDNRRLTVNYAALLAEGEELTGTPAVVVEAIASGPGEDSDLSFTNLSVDGSRLVFWVDGGVHGTTYRLQATVETTQGQTLQADCLLLVSDGVPPLATPVVPKTLTPLAITYSDAIEYLQVVTNSGGLAKSIRDFKQAIQSAYTDLRLAYSDWTHYLTEYRVWLSAPFAQGTVEYVAAGHAQGPRALVFSQTPPDWMVQGRVRVGQDIVAVRQATADPQVFLLDEVVSPADSFAAKSFSAYRSHYPLPDDLLHMENLVVEEGPWHTRYILPEEWMHHERLAATYGRTWAWTILPDRWRHGAYSLVVCPQPDAVESLGFFYSRGLSLLRWSGSEPAAMKGTATGSRGSNIVSLVGGEPQATMAGCVLRLSGSTSAPPTSPTGTNPFAEQHLIVDVQGNNLTLAAPLQHTYAGNRYLISDLIDIGPTMTEALWAGVRWQYRQLTGDRRAGHAQQDYYRAVRVAKENERRTPGGGISLRYLWPRFGEMPHATQE